MRKFAMLAVVIECSFVLFLTVAAVIILASAASRDNGSSLPSDVISADDRTTNVTVLSILNCGEKQYAAKITLPLPHGTVSAEPISAERLTEIDTKRQKYIIFDEKIFEEITDRYGGLVYNESGIGEVLLTGGQAVGRLGPISFCDFCEQIAQAALDRDISSLFFYLADNTENNLNYPHFYDALNKR